MIKRDDKYTIFNKTNIDLSLDLVIKIMEGLRFHEISLDNFYQNIKPNCEFAIRLINTIIEMVEQEI